MATPATIKDADSANSARVTRFGQLVVAPIDFSEPVEVEMTVIGQVYNVLTPKQGQNVVITDIIVNANKNVSATTPADVRIYESDESDSSTVIESIVSPQLIRSSSLVLNGLNLLVPEGRWVNATTDDNDILITIMYYRVPVERQ